VILAGSGGEGWHVVFSDLGVGVGEDGDAASGQDLESEVAASFGPFVGLFGEDGADQSDDGLAGGEDPDDVGAAADLAVEPLVYPALAVGASVSVVLIIAGGRC
jgi:hypothetical protein